LYAILPACLLTNGCNVVGRMGHLYMGQQEVI